MRKIQQLSLFGAAGQAAAEQTTPKGVLQMFLQMFRQMTRQAAPLDLAAFFACHHAGKVNRQDLDFVDDARQRADAQGQDATALRELARRLKSTR